VSNKKKKLTKPSKKVSTSGGGTKSKKIVEYPIEKVFWKDHWTGNGQWSDKVENPRALICTSVGIRVHEDNDVLMLAQNMSPNERFADTITIIKGCITKRSKLGSIFYDKE
jgi:hypothetical protein